MDIQNFEKSISDIMDAGATDRETALRWFVQANDFENECDPGYVCYCLGLPYTMKDIFKPFLKCA